MRWRFKKLIPLRTIFCDKQNLLTRRNSKNAKLFAEKELLQLITSNFMIFAINSRSIASYELRKEKLEIKNASLN